MSEISCERCIYYDDKWSLPESFHCNKTCLVFPYKEKWGIVGLCKYHIPKPPVLGMFEKAARIVIDDQLRDWSWIQAMHSNKLKDLRNMYLLAVEQVREWDTDKGVHFRDYLDQMSQSAKKEPK